MKTYAQRAEEYWHVLCKIIYRNTPLELNKTIEEGVDKSMLQQEAEEMNRKIQFLKKRSRKVYVRTLGILGLIFLLFPYVETLRAQSTDYNRPNPTMDYVSQEIGIYDTKYNALTEQDCRKCHGNSTADRHHATPKVVRDHSCSPCHVICTPGTPNCQNGITLYRNCLTSGCHSWDDVQFGNKKWHHNTDMSASEDCNSCHDPNIIDEITPFRDFQTYPPTVVTPTPYSCENCHYQQPVSVGTGPNHPGHPSTYEHYDSWGNFTGYYAYGKPIYTNLETHHMDFRGNVSTDCYKCHSIDPDNPSWVPENPELIRYCEICHSARTLHAIGPHVSDHDGWRPVGFHAAGSGPNPTTYAKWGPLDYTPQANPGYTDAMQCFGCHGDEVPPWTEDLACNPAIAEISPITGSCGTIVTLRGNCFGDEHIAGRTVQVKKKADPSAAWVDVPIHAWTDSLIEWELPCWGLAPGNYDVKVKTAIGSSNKVVFTIRDSSTALSISPDKGSCGTWITISGSGGFGNFRSQMFSDGYNGVHHVVDFVASSGEYTARSYANWSDTSLDVRIWQPFQDKIDQCSIDPLTGQNRNERNFVQDIGDENHDSLITCGNTAPAYDECEAEPTIPRCTGLDIGTYSVYVKAIYFGDDDASGDLSCGDTIFQVQMSDPVYFELTNNPYVYKLNPKRIELKNILKIFGGNFGPSQELGDCVRIGTQADAMNPALGLGKEETAVRMWSDTLIKVRVAGPGTWQGKTKYVWVEKGGKKSSSKKLFVLAPLP
jgi:hypothetical protein